ncbi:hypothetical protein ABZZ74_54230 [Streptomyces sp. NPDC006476]|uniref:hypothetical protein n=1 Tax=Streptomyces sp. NPDC006476 TaxID=3157175 RepID=UPI0033B4FB48
MSPQHVMPALTAAAVTAPVLATRYAATRRREHVHGPSPARAPWPRTPSRPDDHADDALSAAAAEVHDAALTAVQDAERHVHRYWQQLQSPSKPPE